MPTEAPVTTARGLAAVLTDDRSWLGGRHTAVAARRLPFPLSQARTHCRRPWARMPVAVRLPVMPPVAPMLAKAVGEIPPDHLYEPKWDGFRSIVFRDGDEVEIGSRNERPMARYFPDIVAAVRASLPSRCVVDGEIVVAGPDARGLDFWALQQRLHP